MPLVRTFKEAIESVDCNLVASCLKLVTIFLNKENINLEKEGINAHKVINNYIIFSVVWSLGANIMTQKDQFTFKSFMDGEISNIESDFSSGMDIYGVYLNEETNTFEKWEN